MRRRQEKTYVSLKREQLRGAEVTAKSHLTYGEAFGFTGTFSSSHTAGKKKHWGKRTLEEMG